MKNARVLYFENIVALKKWAIILYSYKYWKDVKSQGAMTNYTRLLYLQKLVGITMAYPTDVPPKQLPNSWRPWAWIPKAKQSETCSRRFHLLAKTNFKNSMFTIACVIKLNRGVCIYIYKSIFIHSFGFYFQKGLKG